MSAVDIILILDVLAVILAAVLFLIGRVIGPPLSDRLALPVKALLVLGLVMYLGTELIIGKEFNIMWGALFIILAAAVFYFLGRPKNRA